MAATIVAAFTTSTVLMVSTLTSAIAISTQSVLKVAEIEPDNLAIALFTLTFLIGVIMFLLGILRLGKIAAISGHLPSIVVPDPNLMPKLALGNAVEVGNKWVAKYQTVD